MVRRKRPLFSNLVIGAGLIALLIVLLIGWVSYHHKETALLEPSYPPISG